MTRRIRRRRGSIVLAASLGVLVLAASLVLHAQEQFAIYLLATDAEGVPLLDLEPADISIREDVGESTIVSVRRFGWPLKVTVLVDNGPGTAGSLVHLRAGLQKFFDGLPREIPVSLIATAPNPRWLFRETTDRIQIERGVNRITPDEGLGRFSDALIEYAARLDEEFRGVTAEQLPPYLPVLVAIATTHQDGSQVVREKSLRMVTSLRRYRAWTHMLMVTPPRPASAELGVPFVALDEGQNAQIAKTVQEVTRGTYTPITAAGTSALSSKLLPELARQIALRYIRQMTQHRIVLQRPEGASGPMRDFKLALFRPGAKAVVSVDGSMP
jgi:hypothetical protein